MESEDIIRRRREKILARQGLSSEQLITEKVQEELKTIKPIEKLNILSHIKQKTLMNQRYNILLSFVMALLAAYLKNEHQVQIQYCLLWGTLLSIIVSTQIRKLNKFSKQIKNDKENLALQAQLLEPIIAKYFDNKRLGMYLVFQLERIIGLMKSFKNVMEGVVTFVFTYMFIHLMI